MPDPNCLLIGAQKCGTSWLAHIIRQHPDVCSGKKKELHFFDKKENYNKGIEWYRSQFVNYNGQKVVGEFTPNYFWTTKGVEGKNDNIPELVYNLCPDAKLILCLRNPVERAISAFYHFIRTKRIHPDCKFEEVKALFGILDMGYYELHLKEWYQFFPPDKFLILIYEEDIAENKLKTIQKTYEFLDLDTGFTPAKINRKINSRSNHLFLRFNYKYPLLGKMFWVFDLFARKFLPKSVNSAIAEIEVEEATKEYLKAHFEPHNKALEKLLGRNLPW